MGEKEPRKERWVKYTYSFVFSLHKAVAKIAEFYEQHNNEFSNKNSTLSGTVNINWDRSNRSKGIFLVDVKNKGLHQKVRSNIVGGFLLSLAATKKFMKKLSLTQRSNQLLVVSPMPCNFRQLGATCSQCP